MVARLVRDGGETGPVHADADHSSALAGWPRRSGATMRLTIVAVGTVLLLVSIGLTLVRTGHPRVVAPLLAGLVGLLVIVTALVVSRSPAPARPRVHRPTPLVAATDPLPTPLPSTQDATGPGYVC